LKTRVRAIKRVAIHPTKGQVIRHIALEQGLGKLDFCLKNPILRDMQALPLPTQILLVEPFLWQKQLGAGQYPKPIHAVRTQYRYLPLLHLT
jgi:hypothetical protein